MELFFTIHHRFSLNDTMKTQLDSLIVKNKEVLSKLNQAFPQAGNSRARTKGVLLEMIRVPVKPSERVSAKQGGDNKSEGVEGNPSL